MPFRSLVETLMRHFELSRQKIEDIYVWIDIFCVNQHNGHDRDDVLPSISQIIKTTDKAS